MANKVPTGIRIANPNFLTRIQDVQGYLANLVSSVSNTLYLLALRANLAMPSDGSEVPTAPVRLNTYAKASLPAASSYSGAMIFVSDDVGGATPAFSDGTNWLRTADRNVIS